MAGVHCHLTSLPRPSSPWSPAAVPLADAVPPPVSAPRAVLGSSRACRRRRRRESNRTKTGGVMKRAGTKRWTHASITSMWEGVTVLDASSWRRAPRPLVKQFEQDLNAASTLAFRVASGCRVSARTPRTWRRRRWSGPPQLRRPRDPAGCALWLVRSTWRMALDWRWAGRCARHREEAVDAAEWLRCNSRTRSGGGTGTRRATVAADRRPAREVASRRALAAIEEHDVAAVSRLLELPRER